MTNTDTSSEQQQSEQELEQQQSEQQPPPPPAGETDWKAKYEETLRASRKHEDRAKANATAARELETLKQQSMSDLEKAVAEAAGKAHAEGVASVNVKLVDAYVVAAVARHKGLDADAVLEVMDRSRFLDADGEPDKKAINTAVDRLAPKAANADLGQGARGATNGSSDDMNTLLRQAAGRPA